MGPAEMAADEAADPLAEAVGQEQYGQPRHAEEDDERLEL